MEQNKRKGRRVVLVRWKQRPDAVYEVFSNLKNFCARYPVFSYNTLNNYLSKQKAPFETDEVHVERLPVLGKASTQRAIEPVVRKTSLKDLDEEKEDVAYWLSRPPIERIAAVTALVMQTLPEGARMDKTLVRKIKMKRT